MKKILLLFALLLISITSRAAMISFSMTNSITLAPDTNVLKVFACGPVNSDGSVNTTGVPIRIQPDTNGYAIHQFAQNNYFVTNAYLGRGYVFRAPLDSSTNNIYASAGPSCLISGLDYFVNLVVGDATNQAVTLNQITNATGFPLLSPTQITNISQATTNGMTSIVYSNPAAFTSPQTVTGIVQSLSSTLAQVTNIAQVQASNIVSGYTTTNQFVAGTNSAYAYAQTQAASALQGSTNYTLSASNSLSVGLTSLVNASSNALAASQTASNAAQASLVASTSNALWWGKQPASGVLSNLAITGAWTNNLTAGTNVVLSTNLSSPSIVYVNVPLQTQLTNGMTLLATTNPLSVLYTNILPGLTNGFVSSGITNGLASYQNLTNYAYPNSNPSNFVTASITNGLVQASVTNGLATTNWVAQNFLTNAAVASNALNSAKQPASGILTNLALTGAYTNPIASGLNTYLTTNTGIVSINASNQTWLTNGLVIPSTNGFVTSSITNGLASTNYVQSYSDTNGAAQAAFVSSTNAAQIYLSKTNGAAYSLAAVNQFSIGTATNFLVSTNLIGVSGAGSGIVNGTYQFDPSGFANSYTNTVNPNAIILISGGSFYIQTNSVSLYSASSVNGAWSQVSGSLPNPSCAYGSYWNMNGTVLLGFITGTNLPTGGGGSGTTNFTLTGVVQSWTTNNQFSTSGSNVIINLISQYASSPTNGISSSTASNIVLNYGGTLFDPLNAALNATNIAFAKLIGTNAWNTLTNGLTTVNMPPSLTNILTGVSGIPVLNGSGTNTTLVTAKSVAATNLAVYGTTWLNNSNLIVSQIVAASSNFSSYITVANGGNYFSGTTDTGTNVNGTYTYTNFNTGVLGTNSFPISNFDYSHTNGLAIYFVGAYVAGVTSSWKLVYVSLGATAVSSYDLTNTTSTPYNGQTFNVPPYNPSTNPTASFSFFGSGTPGYNKIDSQSQSLSIFSTNGIGINTNTSAGFALNVNSNINVSDGYYINGVKISQAATTVYSQLYVTNGYGSATNFNGVFTFNQGGNFYTNNYGWCLVVHGSPPSTWDHFSPPPTNYVLCTNSADYASSFSVPQYISYSLLGVYSDANGSPSTTLPVVSYYNPNQNPSLGTMAYRGTNEFTALQATAIICPNPPPPGANSPTNCFGPWTLGTKSAGFNEAGQYALLGSSNSPGGQKIYVMPGLFDIGEPITNILRQGTMELTYEGSGKLVSMIRQTNSIPMPVFRFNGLGTTNYLNFNLVHLGIFSVTNACTNLTEFIGPVSSFNFRGVIGEALIQDDYFDCWLYATNTGTSGMTPDSGAMGGKKNLCAIFVDNNFGSLFTIRDNEINNSCLWIATDNFTLWHNQLVGYGLSTDWPITDPRASARGVIFTDPSGGANNIHLWAVGHNHFVGNGLPYMIISGGARKDFPIDEDYYEGNGSVIPVTISTTNFNVTFKDCYADFDQVFTNNKVVISTSDYTAGASYAYTSNSIYRLNTTHGMSEYRFNAINPFNVFGGNGSNLTSLNASQLTVGTVPVTTLPAQTTNNVRLLIFTNAPSGPDFTYSTNGAVVTVMIATNKFSGGGGSSFPLTSDQSLGGYSLNNGNKIQANEVDAGTLLVTNAVTFTGTFIGTNIVYTNTTTLPAPQLNSSIVCFSNGVGYVVSAGASLPGVTNQLVYNNSFDGVSIAIGHAASVDSGLSSIAIGSTSASSGGGTSVGTGTGSSNGGTAIGNNASALLAGTALGDDTDGDDRGLAAGQNAFGDQLSVALGYYSFATGSNNVALGPYARAAGSSNNFTNTVEIGPGTASLQGGLNFKGVGLFDASGNLQDGRLGSPINGTQITGLNASQLTAGTVPDARLSANVATLAGTNIFTGINTFSRLKMTNAPTTSAVGMLGLDANGNVVSNAVPSGGSSTTYFSQVLMSRNGDISFSNTYSAPFYFYNGFSVYDPKFNCKLGSGDIVSVNVAMIGIGGSPIGTGNDVSITLVTNGISCTSSKVTLLGSSTSANYSNMTNVLLAVPPHLSTNDVVQILTNCTATNNISGSSYIGFIYSVIWKNYNQ